MGVWYAYGVAPSLTWMCAGGEDIIGNNVEQLKVGSWICSRRYCSNLGMLSSVAETGKLLGHYGRPGNVLVLP